MNRVPLVLLALGTLLLGGCAAPRAQGVQPDPSMGVAPHVDQVPPKTEVAETPPTEDGDADFEDLWDEETSPTVSDPLEPVNRALFWFNDKLYFYLLKPVSRVYRVVPEPARKSVGNFFTNLGTPVRFANSLLQLKFTDASSELARFMINSTFGIGGLFDVVKTHGGPTAKKEDFGQTLGRYGAGQGFYLVLPVLGPSSLRDGVGTVADWYLDPLAYYLRFEERIGLSAVKTLNTLSLDKDTYESIVREQIDPYLFVRDAYIQRRAGMVAQ